MRAGAGRSDRRKLANVDGFTVLFGMPEVVLHLLGQPALGAAAERLRQPDCHLGRDAETPVEQELESVARDRQPFRGLGDRQTERLKALAPDEGARVGWIVHQHRRCLLNGSPGNRHLRHDRL